MQAPPRVGHCCSPASKVEGAWSRAPRSRVETPVFGSPAAGTGPKASGYGHAASAWPIRGLPAGSAGASRHLLRSMAIVIKQVVRVLIDAGALVLSREKDRQSLRIQADVTGIRGGPTASAQMIISVMGAGAL